MSTRVFPDPAGAMTRAGPPTWATAASWSGARSAWGAVAAGTTVSTPRSTESLCTTARPGGAGIRGPPSIHAGVPSGSVMSASPSGVLVAASSSRAALTAHHQTGSPARASYVLAQVRKCRRSNQGSASGAARHGSIGNDCGSRKRAGSSPRAMTTGSRASHAACRRATAAAGSASTASSIVTTGASRHGAGTGDPDDTTTPRPRGAGPGTGTAPNLRRGCRSRQGAVPSPGRGSSPGGDRPGIRDGSRPGTDPAQMGEPARVSGWR